MTGSRRRRQVGDREPIHCLFLMNRSLLKAKIGAERPRRWSEQKACHSRISKRDSIFEAGIQSSSRTGFHFPKLENRFQPVNFEQKWIGSRTWIPTFLQVWPLSLCSNFGAFYETLRRQDARDTFGVRHFLHRQLKPKIGPLFPPRSTESSSWSTLNGSKQNQYVPSLLSQAARTSF